MNRHFLAQSCKTLLHSCASYSASFIKISFMFGSRAAFFSATSFFEPLIGTFATPWMTTFYALSKTLITFSMHASSSLLFLVYHIPLLCASWYFNTLQSSVRARILYSLIPLVCIGAFCLHPIGQTVAWYSIFWCIPLITLWSCRNFFFHALGSTLVSHAVGSVLWLYNMPTTATFWTELFPIACCERLLFAAGMTLCYYLASSCYNMTHINALVNVGKLSTHDA